MLAHLVDWMEMASGQLPTAPRRRLLRYPGVKHLVIYWLPFPKGVPTAPELVARTPSDWSAECTALSRHLESFVEMESGFAWPEHPAFGMLTPKAWGTLAYRHIDHHLRQFGV